MATSVPLPLPLLLLLLSLLSCLHLGSCALRLEVDEKEVELEESGERRGERLQLPRRLSLSIACRLIGDKELENPRLFWLLPGNATLPNPRFEVSERLSPNRSVFTSTLTVASPASADIGEYACSGNTSSEAAVARVGGLTSKPLLTLRVNGKKSNDEGAWPGSRVAILCEVEGNPVGNVTWRHDSGGKALGSELVIEDVSFERDRGDFVCEATNRIGSNSATLYLRVKNPTGFLVPMIVVIVEIAIIAVIVLAYELAMRKKRQQMEDSDPKSD